MAIRRRITSATNDIVFTPDTGVADVSLGYLSKKNTPLVMTAPLKTTKIPKEIASPEIISHLMERGFSMIRIRFHIYGTDQANLEALRHDLSETLENAALFTETKGSRGTKSVFEYKLDSAAAISYKTVFFGWVDERGVRGIEDKGLECGKLENLELNLVCEPYWRPSVAIELGPNEVKTASFEEDRDVAPDGLADNWVEEGTPTTTMETTKVLHGCYSQKVVTDNNSLEGIHTGNIAHASLTSAVAYAWVARDDPGDDIAVEIWDTVAAGVIATALLSTGGWETEMAGGMTWSRLVVSSDVLIAGRNYFLRIVRRLADATQITTYYVDKTFWLYGTLAPTPVPDEWIGHYAVWNHYDGEFVWNATTEDPHHNYLDVDDLKGDVDARIFIDIDQEPPGAAATTKGNYIIGRRTRDAPGCFPHIYEAENFAVHVAWGSLADKTCSNGSKKSNVAADATGSTRTSIAATIFDYHLGRFRVLARAYTNDVVNSFLRVSTRYYLGEAWAYNNWKGFNQNADAIWSFVDLGSIYWDRYMRDGIVPREISIQVEFQKDAADTIELDFVMLVPEDEYLMMLAQSHVPDVGDHHVYDKAGEFDYVAIEFSGDYNVSLYRHGELFLGPEVENRLYFQDYFALNSRWRIHHEIANWFSWIELWYLPQYISPLE